MRAAVVTTSTTNWWCIRPNPGDINAADLLQDDHIKRRLSCADKFIKCALGKRITAENVAHTHTKMAILSFS